MIKFQKSEILKRLNQLGLLAFVGAWFGIFQSCADVPTAAPPPMPTSKWGEKYVYNYELPDKDKAAPNSVAVTVAVVNPAYKEDESVLKTSLYSKIGKGF